MTHDELSTMLVEAAARGCCDNDVWRFDLCTYHQGYREGVDAGIEAYAKLLLITARNDGDVDGARQIIESLKDEAVRLALGRVGP